MSSIYIKNVALVGAGGQQGRFIAEELAKTGKHTVTAITRAESTANIPQGVKSVTVDYENESTLVEALRGQDMLIITMAVTAPRDTQGKLIRAAVEAGVAWVMPNEWGNDYTDEAVAKDTMIGMGILATRKAIEDTGKLNWIGLACGFWYDYSLGTSKLLYGFDMRNKEVTFYDEGNVKLVTSTWSLVGKAVASLLSLPIESSSGLSLTTWKNDMVRVGSFVVNQKEMLESVQKATNTTDKDWTIKYEPAKQRWEDGIKEFDGGKGNRRGFGKALYARMFFPDGAGMLSGKLDNEKLGLPKEDIVAAAKEGYERGMTTDVFGDHA